MSWWYGRIKSLKGVNIMSRKKIYTDEYRANAVMLAQKVGGTKAAKELGLCENTLYNWKRNAEKGLLPLPAEGRNPKISAALADRVKELEAENRNLKVEVKRLAEEREILEKATRFFVNVQKKC
jgi:transposase